MSAMEIDSEVADDSTDEVMSVRESDFENNNNADTQVVKRPRYETDVPIVRNIRNDTFSFKNNDLFKFLNDPSNLSGRIILGKFLHGKGVDYARLKELIIMRELSKDPVTFKIKESTFVKLCNEVMELFPSLDPDLLYVPYCRSETDSTVISARGGLYNTYKYLREQLRKAGILKPDSAEIENDDASENAHLNTWDSLTNPKQFSASDTIRRWEETFQERHALLLPSKIKKNKPIGFECYLKTFPCLKMPLGLVLLQSDFNVIIKNFVTSNPNSSPLLTCHSTLFVDSWPGFAPHIVQSSKTSKNKDVKEFLNEYKQIVTEGKHDSIIALYLLPLMVTLPKSNKNKDSNTSFDKDLISRSFILRIKDSNNLTTAKEEHEAVLKSCGLPVHPYVVFCGDNLEVGHSYVVLNGELYLCAGPLQAIEACFKCLVALNTWPYLCDYVWHIIHKLIYGQHGYDPIKPCVNAVKFVVEIRRLFNL